MLEAENLCTVFAQIINEWFVRKLALSHIILRRPHVS